jgi:hypothetical protein
MQLIEEEKIWDPKDYKGSDGKGNMLASSKNLSRFKDEANKP